MARERRKLAAIVAADVVGYSRLMGRDESGTVARLRKNRLEHLDPDLAKYAGRLVKLTGDGALIEFGSAVDALSAAIEFQQAMAEANQDQPPETALVFRMGLHLGDLIVDGDDLYGDGVNVAARLEGEAPPGGILTSRTVHEAVAGKVKARFDDLGSLRLKNIERPVQAFSVTWDPLDWQHAVTAETTLAPYTPLQLPDKPSIAVLPFQNMSGDPEQEYFVDGLVEDVITALSRFKSLFVIARNSSFSYKGRAVDIKQVGRELGVRYVLEGSVRKAGGRVRITGQLIDSQTGVHLWADRFDGALEDVFDLQDRITVSIVGAIAPKIDQAELDRSKRKPIERLDAYDCFLRGMEKINGRSRESLDDALSFANRAIELDPDFSTPYGLAAACYNFRKNSGWMRDEARESEETRQVAMQVQRIGSEDGRALAWAGRAVAFVCREYDVALSMTEQATRTNPSLAAAWSCHGTVNLWYGHYEEGVEQLLRAIRMSPLDLEIYQSEAFIGWGYVLLGNYAEAIEWANRARARRPDVTPPLRVLATAYALAGGIEEAKRAAARMIELDPQGHTMSHLRKIAPYRRREDADRVLDGLRLAGVPE